MARPFRLQPPSLHGPMVARSRLAARMAERWDRRLITIVAGPGFGKTVQLTAAMIDGSHPARARDVWLSCDARDDDAEHLTAGLSAACGLPAGDDLDAIVDWVWAQAPSKVCFLFDDVQDIGAGSGGATVLGRLIDDLPNNGHVVLASRAPVPVPLARLGASRQLTRITEEDLLFDDAEIETFASARGVDRKLLASAGGWPALAELTATAGTDLVLDYLWEEILTRLGHKRMRDLARFAVVGGGDDEVASALAGRAVRIDELLADLPMVERADTGWAALHALWLPALRQVVDPADADDARRRAAEVHRRRGRASAAVDLLAEAEAWTDVLAVVREAAIDQEHLTESADFGRWWRVLPPEWRDRPAAVLAAGLERQTRAPLEAAEAFGEAASGFRAEDDVLGELAAMAQEGLVRWWANDVSRLLTLNERVTELAADGWEPAQRLGAIAAGAVGHVLGDSDMVLSGLADLDDAAAGPWLDSVLWLRSVAYRRRGDLSSASRELDRSTDPATARLGPQVELSRLRIDWLAGRVDRAVSGLAAVERGVALADDHFLTAELRFELAAKVAWLGDVGSAETLIAAVGPQAADLPGALIRILRLIARGAIAVDAGDEAAAAALVRDEELAAPGRAESWYWRDRSAIALPYVLVPDSRAGWEAGPLGSVHQPGLQLAGALVAARANDLGPVRDLTWPDVGVVRAHLPAAWIAELAAAGAATGNDPPEDLLAAVGRTARRRLREIGSTGGTGGMQAAAYRLAKAIPVKPPYLLRIEVLGPLRVSRGDDPAESSELRRRRVRELLCCLVAHRRARRELVADELWPEGADSSNNLRVNLAHLQRLMQPDRPDGEPPYFLRADKSWLVLHEGDGVEVDVWRLDAHLDDATDAERTGHPGAALASYRAALALWRGEPYEDAPDADWALPERARLRSRFSTAAVRAGDLLVAAGAAAEARDAAHLAIAAEPLSEPGYRLLIRSHLAEHDSGGARQALDECRAALSRLGLEPEPTTLALLPQA